MYASPPPGLFKPPQQGHSLATLVLIENSAAMVDRWPDLRDHYLPTLLGTVRKVNPVVPIQVLWLTSCPVSASEEAIASPNNSRLNHLPEVRFSPQPNNKITAATLFCVTDILARTFLEKNTSRHLFVIAASGPSENTDVPSLPGADPQTVWQTLGLKLTKENIHLHMILNPNLQESEKFRQLFYEVLAMQQNQEAATWFPANTENYHFLLSMRPQGHQEDMSRPFPSTAPHRTPVGYAGTASAVSPSLLTPTSGISGLSIVSPITAAFPDASAPPPQPSLLTQAPQRMPLPRNNSFPPAGANGRPPPRSMAISSTNNSPPSSVASIPSGSDGEAKPSLVKHLQKIHGLTKKRNYGLQTSRAPFIRDETTSSAPSVDPANGRPRRNTGVHASKSKKGDDPRRPRRGSVHAGLSDSVRVSSPESDSSTSVSAPSPTATVAGVLVSSPTGPVPVGLQMGMPVSNPSLNLAAEPSYATVPPPPSLWQQSEALVQQAPSANQAPAFTDVHPSQHLQPPGIGPPQAQAQGQVQRAHVRVTAPLASSSYSNVPHGNADSSASVAYPTTVGSTSSFVPQQPAHHTTPPAPALAPAPAPVDPLAAAPVMAQAQAPVPMSADDGDKPFIFYPEYEDALGPPLFPHASAAAQPAQMAQYWTTASADYSQIVSPAIAPGLVLRASHPTVYDVPMYDSAAAHTQPAHSHISSHAQPGVVYASEQCSSLQSWAGY